MKFNDFILSGKDHIVLSDYGPSADRRNADLFFRTPDPSLTPVINILVLVVKRFIDCVCQRKGSS